MTCPHCADRIAELEDEIRCLKRELALSTDEREVAIISEHFRSVNGEGRPAVARMISYLYGTRGRPVHWLALLEAVPPRYERTESLDRADNLVRVWISCARKYLGRDAITTVHGVGYRLSPSGLETVSAILNG